MIVVQSTPPPQQLYQHQQYQYDYEDEITTTARPSPVPVQLQSRPKYAAPTFQFTPSSTAPPPPQSQFSNSIDIIYADPRQLPASNVKSQYQSFDDRRPPQFPQQERTSAISRADEFALFAPADSRGDIYKPKVRTFYIPSSHAHKRRKKRKNVYIVLRKRKTYIY